MMSQAHRFQDDDLRISTRAKRLAPEKQGHSAVQIIGKGRNGACIIELVAARSRDVLSAAFATVCRLGFRLVHTEVRVSRGQIVQRLHLLESDESPPKPRRALHALHALSETFIPPPVVSRPPLGLSHLAAQ